MAEKWFKVGGNGRSSTYVFATQAAVDHRGYYARRSDGRRVSIEAGEHGATLEITEPNGWDSARETFTSVNRAKRAIR